MGEPPGPVWRQAETEYRPRDSPDRLPQRTEPCARLEVRGVRVTSRCLVGCRVRRPLRVWTCPSSRSRRGPPGASSTVTGTPLREVPSRASGRCRRTASAQHRTTGRGPHSGAGPCAAGSRRQRDCGPPGTAMDAGTHRPSGPEFASSAAGSPAPRPRSDGGRPAATSGHRSAAAPPAHRRSHASLGPGRRRLPSNR